MSLIQIFQTLVHISVRYVVSELWCSHLGAAGFVVKKGEGGVRAWRGYGRSGGKGGWAGS